MQVGGRTVMLAARSFMAGVLALAALCARAVPVPDLYEITVPIASSRDAAFSDALKAVAVKVSGQRDAALRLGIAADKPQQFVQRFAFTADNQLQVAFDTGSVDRLLSESGLPIWGRERPATLVLLNIPATDGSAMWVDASYPAPERDALMRVAKLRGLPLVWPTIGPQELSVLGITASPPTAELLALAHRFNANAVLLGHGRRDGGPVRWTLVSAEGRSEASGSIEDGVHLAADTFGRLYSASGSSLRTIAVDVSGIANLDDYANALNYLEGMTLVRSVSLEKVSGDTVRFMLAVRGDATTLRRALALDNRLVPASAEGVVAAGGLQLRFQRQ